MRCLSLCHSSNSPHRDIKNSLQYFLSQPESNCSTLRTHRPVVEKNRSLRSSIDSYNSNTLELISRFDEVEKKFSTLVAKKTSLNAQIGANTSSQEAIITKKEELQSQAQQLIAEYHTKSATLIHSQLGPAKGSSVSSH